MSFYLILLLTVAAVAIYFALVTLWFTHEHRKLLERATEEFSRLHALGDVGGLQQSTLYWRDRIEALHRKWMALLLIPGNPI